jgi:hypothetical protein
VDGQSQSRLRHASPAQSTASPAKHAHFSPRNSNTYASSSSSSSNTIAPNEATSKYVATASTAISQSYEVDIDSYAATLEEGGAATAADVSRSRPMFPLRPGLWCGAAGYAKIVYARPPQPQQGGGSARRAAMVRTGDTCVLGDGRKRGVYLDAKSRRHVRVRGALEPLAQARRLLSKR